MNAAAANAFDVFRLHGGKVEAARSLFPDVRAPWIDLSTGISPWAYPYEGIAREAFTRLPDPEAVAALEAAAAAGFGVADPACVVATPGSDLALRLMGRIFAGRRVAVVRPGYSGHLLAWGEAPVTSVAARDIESVVRDHDVVVLANPNNPDGRLIGRGLLLDVAGALAKRAGVLIVDEAFADVMPGESLCGSLERVSNVVVFRSFGKFFGLAGVRLGFVVAASSGPGRASRRQDSGEAGGARAAAELAERVIGGAVSARVPAANLRSAPADHGARAFRAAMGDWPVSGPAVAVGTAAYRDLQWQSLQRRRLTATAERLDALLMRAGLTIAGGTVLFRLARCADADAVFKHLAAHGILTRPFASDGTLLRVGLPADEAQWQQLTMALDSRRIP
jgi:cobalamin biosynthetic protein CobC